MSGWLPHYQSEEGISARLVLALVVLVMIICLAAGSWIGWISHAYF